jgi:hypothetical protein
MKILLILLALTASAYSQASVLTVQEANGVLKKAGITKIVVTNGTLSISGTTATIETGGGGEGAPGGDPGQIQYNDTGTFGGIAGFTTDGTNVTATSGVLRATAPRITTSILDSNGNELFLFTATGSAVNEVRVANAATGNNPTFTASGGDTDVGINFVPKGAGAIQVSGSTIATAGNTLTLANKTLTTPTIGDFSNATHTHANAAGGGTLNASAIAAGTLALARGGTGASLADPGADRIIFWDDSAGAVTFLEVGSGLTITDTTLTATGGSGNLDIGTTAIDNGTATRLLYETAGNVLGEVTGFTSDGTNVTAGSGNLRSTRQRVITSIDDTNGNELFSVTATGSAVNQFGVANAATGDGPTLSSVGETNVPINIAPAGTGALNVSAPLNMTGTGTVAYTTPGTAATVQTKIALPSLNLGGFAQMVALGIPSTANSTSRVLSLFDARSTAHQPTLAVFTPDENNLGGFSWDGSDTIFGIKTTVTNGIIKLLGGFGAVTGVAFADLGTPANGTFTFVTDGTVTSGADNTCAGSGTGAFAVRLNSVWRCFSAQN